MNDAPEIRIDAVRADSSAAPSTALALAREAGPDTVTRDRFIVLAAAGGDSPSVIAEFLELSRQQVYTVLEAHRQLDATDRDQFTIEQESAWRSTESALEAMTGGEDFERLVHRLIYDIDPGVRPLGGVGDRARDAVADLGPGDGSVYSISLEKQWTRKVRREVSRVVGFGYRPAFVYAVTNRKTTRDAEDRLERWAYEEQGVRLRVLGQRWLVTKLLHPDYLGLRQEMLGLALPSPRVFFSPEDYRRLLNGRRAMLGLQTRRVGSDEVVTRLLAHLRVRPAAVLSGPGGIGKTRLVLDAAAHAPQGEVWRFLDEATAVAPTALGQLAGTQEMVVVIDNAHRRSDLTEVLGLLERRQPRPKVIFVVRPHRVESVENATAAVWIGGLSERDYLAVEPLESYEIAELIKNSPFNLTYRGMVRAVVGLADGNPQIAVLAATLARDGLSIVELGRAEIFRQHVAGLLSTVTEQAAEPRQLRELLAIVAALGSVDRNNNDVIATASGLIGFGPPAVRRWLGELADLGLLIERARGQFAIKPDLLAEQVLASSFFSKRWQPLLDYRDVVAAFSSEHLLDLCNAVGQVPPGELDPQHPGLRALSTEVMSALSGPDIRTAAELIRGLLPGAEGLILRDFEALVERTEHQPQLLDGQAGVTLVEATQRITQDLATGWTLLLRLMAVSNNADLTDAARSAMKSVFQRVPIDTSKQDGWILAAVQTVLAQTSRTYANRASTPGQLRAAAAAGQALMAITFETSMMSVETKNEIVLTSYVLPGTESTEQALLIGVDVLTSTFMKTSVAEQLRSVEAATELARHAAGFPGPFGIRLDPNAQALAYKALAKFDQFATEEFDKLPLPTRAATLGYLHARRHFAKRAAQKRTQDALEQARVEDGLAQAPSLPARSEELDEFIELFYPKSIDPPTEYVSWEEAHEAQRARCRLIARRLASEPDWAAHIGRWETWAQQTSELFERASSSSLGVVIAEVARLKPRRAIAIIDHLIKTESPLRTETGRAINYLVAQRKAGPKALDRWSDSDEASRATLANAIAELDHTHAIRTFQRLALDKSAIVRRGALSGLRYGNTTTQWRISTGLRVAMELADIEALDLILEVADAAELELTSDLARQATEALLATADRERVDVYDLERTLRHLESVTGDLTLQWIWKRIDWLESSKRRSWILDVLPGPLEQRVREHAAPEDLDTALRRFERVDTSLLASDALLTLLNWIDPGSPATTDMIIRLYNEPGGGPRARALLRLDLSWQQCRTRAEVLAERLDPDVATDLIEAMLPTTWTVGSYAGYVEAALDHIRGWADETPPGPFVDALRTSMAVLKRTLARERATNERRDDLSAIA